MRSFKNSLILKIISLLLVISFVNLDFAWAYTEVSSPNRNLAVWSAFQKPIYSSHIEPLSEIAGRMELVSAIGVISGFLFGRDGKDKGEFGRLAAVLQEKYGDTLSNIDINRVFPLEYLEEYKDALENNRPIPNFDYSRTISDKDYIVIPYKQAGRTTLILVSKKGHVPASGIMGYEWKNQPLKDYMITVLPVDHEIPESWDKDARIVKDREVKYQDLASVSRVGLPDYLMPSSTELLDDISSLTSSAQEQRDSKFSLRKLLGMALALTFILSTSAFASDTSQTFSEEIKSLWENLSQLSKIVLIQLGVGVVLGFEYFKSIVIKLGRSDPSIKIGYNHKFYSFVNNRAFKLIVLSGFLGGAALAGNISTILNPIIGIFFGLAAASYYLKYTRSRMVSDGGLSSFLDSWIAMGIMEKFRAITIKKGTYPEEFVEYIADNYVGERDANMRGYLARMAVQHANVSNIKDLERIFNWELNFEDNNLMLMEITKVIEELKLKADSDSHPFNAISGLRWGIFSGILSSGSIATGIWQYLVQGSLTYVTGLAVAVGMYFAWSAARCFSMGFSTYRVMRKTGLTFKEAWHAEIASSDGWRHDAYERSDLIELHESFDSHFWGMLAIMPLISVSLSIATNIWQIKPKLPEGVADYAVAIGCSIQEDGTASTHSIAVAEESVSLLRDGKVRKIIFSGGNSQNGITEAQAMKNYALQIYPEGADRFLMDMAPKDKFGTEKQIDAIRYTIREDQADESLTGVSVIGVAQYLHARRAIGILRKKLENEGVNVYQSPAEKSKYEKYPTQPQFKAGEMGFLMWEILNFIRVWAMDVLKGFGFYFKDKSYRSPGTVFLDNNIVVSYTSGWDLIDELTLPSKKAISDGFSQFRAMLSGRGFSPDLMSFEVAFETIEDARKLKASDIYNGNCTYHVKKVRDTIINLAVSDTPDIISDPNSELYAIVTEIKPRYVSVHLGWSAEEVELGPTREHEYDVPAKGYENLDRDTLMKNMVKNINELKKNLGEIPLLVEMLNYQPDGAYEHVTDPAFIREVLKRTGVGLLFDCAHMLVSAKNMGYTGPGAYMDYIRKVVDDDTVKHIHEIHLSVPVPSAPGSKHSYDDFHLPFFTESEAAGEVQNILRYILDLRTKNNVTTPLTVNFETGIQNAGKELPVLAGILGDLYVPDKEYLDPVFKEFGLVPSFTVNTSSFGAKDRGDRAITKPLNLEVPVVYTGLENELESSGLERAPRTFHFMIIGDEALKKKEMFFLLNDDAQEILEDPSLYETLAKYHAERPVSVHLGLGVKDFRVKRGKLMYEQLPPDMTESKAKATIIARIEQLRSNLRKNKLNDHILLENCDYFPGNRYVVAPEFIREIAQATDSGLLVDLMHIAATALHDKPEYSKEFNDMSPLEYLKALVDRDNISSVGEIHIAVPAMNDAGEWKHARMEGAPDLPFHVESDGAILVKGLLAYILGMRKKAGVETPLIINFETNDKFAREDVAHLAEFIKEIKALDMVSYAEGIDKDFMSSFRTPEMEGGRPISAEKNILEMSDDEILSLMDPRYGELRKHAKADLKFARAIAEELGYRDNEEFMNKLRVISLAHDIGGILGYKEHEAIESGLHALMKDKGLEWKGVAPDELLGKIKEKGIELDPSEEIFIPAIDHANNSIRALEKAGIFIPEDVRFIISRHMDEPSEDELKSWPDETRALFAIFMLADVFECGNNFYKQKGDYYKHESKFEDPRDTLAFIRDKKMRGRDSLKSYLEAAERSFSGEKFQKALAFSRTPLDQTSSPFVKTDVEITRSLATRATRSFKKFNVIPSYTLNASKDPGDPKEAVFRHGLERFRSIFEMSEVKVPFAFEDQCRSEDEIDKIEKEDLFSADKRTLHLKILQAESAEKAKTLKAGRYEINLAAQETMELIANEKSVIYRITERMNPEYVSLHLSASVEDRKFATQDAPWESPVPGSVVIDRDELLRRFSENIIMFRNNLRKTGYKGQILVESLDYHDSGAYEHITEPSFIKELLYVVNKDFPKGNDQVGLLVDCAHIVLAARNLNFKKLGYHDPDHGFMGFVEDIVNGDTISLIKELHLVVPEYDGVDKEYQDTHLPFIAEGQGAEDVKKVLEHIFRLRRKYGVTQPLIVNFESNSMTDSAEELIALADLLEGIERRLAEDRENMKTILDLAEQEEGVPVAAMVFNHKTGEKITGLRENLPDGVGHEHGVVDHCEMVALKEAVRKGWDLTECTLYVTMENCYHCAKAVVNNFRPGRVVIGSMDPLIKGRGEAVIKHGKVFHEFVPDLDLRIRAEKIIREFYGEGPAALDVSSRVMNAGDFDHAVEDPKGVLEACLDGKVGPEDAMDLFDWAGYLYLKDNPVFGTDGPMQIYLTNADISVKAIDDKKSVDNAVRHILYAKSRINPKIDNFRFVLIGSEENCRKVAESVIKEAPAAGLDNIEGRLYIMTDLDASPVPAQDILKKDAGSDGLNTRATELYEIVAEVFNNRRARMVKDADDIIRDLAAEGVRGDEIGFEKIDKDAAAVVVAGQVRHVVGLAREYPLTGELDIKLSELEDSAARIIAENIITSLISLGRNMPKDHKGVREPFIYAFETDWIPGYEDDAKVKNAMFSIIREVRDGNGRTGIGQAIASMGLENINIVHAESGRLADAVLDAAGDRADLSNVVIMGGLGTVESADFRAKLLGRVPDQMPFIAGIDTSKFDPDVIKAGRYYPVDILMLMSLALDFARGRELRGVPIEYTVDGDNRRMIVFVPEMAPVDYQALVDYNRALLRVLQAA